MMDIIRDVVTNYAKFMDKEFFSTGKEFNLPSRINDLQVKIILNCAFGIDLADYELPYRKNGVDTMEKYSYVLKTLLNEIPMRTF
jgi:hypothetical protein